MSSKAADILQKARQDEAERRRKLRIGATDLPAADPPPVSPEPKARRPYKSRKTAVVQMLESDAKPGGREDKSVKVEFYKGQPTRIVPSYKNVENIKDRALCEFKFETDEDELVAALSLQAEDSKMGKFHALLMKPEYSFQKAFKAAGLTLMELEEFWADTQKHRGILQMMNHLPKVLDQTARSALNREVECGRCNGKGELVYEERPVIEKPGGKLEYGLPELRRRPCPDCRSGKIEEPGDLESRKLMFRISGLTKPEGGVNVNVDNRSVTINGVEDTVSGVGKILEMRPLNGGLNGGLLEEGRPASEPVAEMPLPPKPPDPDYYKDAIIVEVD